MTTFEAYLRLGFEHLLDLSASDHILFLVALCSSHSPARWRRLLLLVTAFTLGHSVALALATLRVIRVDAQVVEFLIPVTIVVTAIVNVAMPAASAAGPPQSPRGRTFARPLWPRYSLVLFFGVVHGLGFSSFLRVLLGEESSILLPLLSFNLGLEIAQVVVAGAVLALTTMVFHVRLVSRRAWTWTLSTLAGAPALVTAIQRWPL